jgi:hypothetical protein
MYSKLLVLGMLLMTAAAAAADYKSHPPLRDSRLLPGPPLTRNEARFVDPQRGADNADGSERNPWQTINRALNDAAPGLTIYLRGGTYYENVYAALTGTADAPITIRSYPGERAIVDGGIPAFFADSANAWEPAPDGADGEYRSSRPWPNLRDCIGAFGDSMVGLQTYWHRIDLQAKNEYWQHSKGEDAKPVYCGPGLWYDRNSGYLHARLAHTNLDGFPNYQGETDPRKLPLVIAPFRSVPLRLDGCQHVTIADLVIRGGGYDTVVIRQSADVIFDNVVVHCGTYGLRAMGLERFRFLRSALFGNMPPWGFRTENRLRSRRAQRDIARLTAHALLVTAGFSEFSVFAFPCNNDWEIAWSEFTDGHDGPYLGGMNVHFHHNVVDALHDDGIYLSPMYPYTSGTVRIEQNRFSRCLTSLAFGGPNQTTDDIYIYRNIFDLRGRVNYNRPSGPEPGKRSSGSVMGDHGSPPWPQMKIYHNTVVQAQPARRSGMRLFNATAAERPRRLFNNILFHQAGLPRFQGADPARGLIADANLYWLPGTAEATANAYFNKFRGSDAYAASKTDYAAGSTTHSRAADPQLTDVEGGVFVPAAGSPAAGGGVVIPADWPDPLRPAGGGSPDIGAVPVGDEMPACGRFAGR